MLALTVIPAEVWRAPVNDEVYSGFDPNLISTTGVVQTTRSMVTGTARSSSLSTISLATALRQRLAASVDVSVLANEGASQPFRIGVWSPWTVSGYFVVFGPAPDNQVSVESVTEGDAGPTLLGGHEVSTPIGRYEPGKSYRATFIVERAAGYITANVLGEGLNSTSTLTSAQSPALFGNVQLSLSASGQGGQGGSRFTLRNFSLMLPHERSWAADVADSLAKGLLVGLILLGLIAIALAAVARWGRTRDRTRRALALRASWLALGVAVLYLVGNAALFPLGGHPFDFGDEQLYAYVGRAYGPAHLFFLPDVTSAQATNWDGIPWLEAAFPYEPVIAYVFTAIGWIVSVLFAGAGLITRASDQLGYVIKSVNVLFGLADGALIYLILRELKVSERWSRIGAALFIFNPAVWFSMSVWGQTHVISIFFVLLCVLFVQRGMPVLAWTSLAAAVLTRPQMVVFGLLLGIVLIKRFTWRQNLAAVSWSVVVTFIALAPLTLATSPSLPVDILLHNFTIQEAGGNQPTLTTVSQSAYSLWPLVTYAFHGMSGVERAFTPSSQILVGNVTYQRASQTLTVVAMVVVAWALAVRKRSEIDSGGYLPLVAIGVTSFLMLLTGIVATHFLLALPMLLLCRRWMDTVAYCYVVVIWSISTFVPMFGDMGNVISSSAYPLLSPDHNVVTRFVVALYGWDRFITVAIVANICAVVWLAVLALRRTARPDQTTVVA